MTRPDNSHLDFTEGAKVPAVSWTKLVHEHNATASSEVPPYNKDDTSEPPRVGMFWPKRGGEYELIEYTQKVGHCFLGATRPITISDTR